MNFGARPLRRRVEQLIENPVASMLIGQASKMGTTIRVSVAGDQLKIEPLA